MKLLNSDKIVDFIDKHSKAIDEDYEKTYTLDQIQEYLDAMPADYDVDSVVAELERQRGIYRLRGIESVHKGMAISSKEHLIKQLSFEHAIKIVKNGYIVYMNNIMMESKPEKGGIE